MMQQPRVGDTRKSLMYATAMNAASIRPRLAKRRELMMDARVRAHAPHARAGACPRGGDLMEYNGGEK
jgi:hypothetical protein